MTGLCGREENNLWSTSKHPVLATWFVRAHQSMQNLFLTGIHDVSRNSQSKMILPWSHVAANNIVEGNASGAIIWKARSN